MIGIGLSLTKAAAVGGVGSLLAKLLRRAQAVARALGSPLLYVPDDYLKLGPDVKGSMASGWGGADARFTYAEGSVSWNGAAGANTSTTKVYLPVSYYNKLVKLEFTVTGYSGSGNGGIDSGALSTLPNDAAGSGAIDTRVAANGSYTFVGYWRGGGATDGRTLPILGRGTNGFTLTINSVQEILSASDYQDSAGTLPAYLGSTVGLLTDRAYGGELGDNLCTNGDFSSGTTGWTVQGSTISVVSGKLSVETTSGAGGAWQDVPTVAGKTYEVVAGFDSAIAASLKVYVGGAFTTTLYNGTDSATIRQERAVFQATSSTSRVYLRNGGIATCLYDNISVRELKGNHATQSTAGARPLLARSPRKTKGPTNLLTYSQDFSNAAWNRQNLSAAPAANYDGAMSASAISVVSTGAATLFTRTGVASPSTAATVAYLVKATGTGTRSFLLRNGTTLTNFDFCTFDLQTGAITGAGWDKVSVGSGWYLISYARSTGISIGDSLITYSGYTGTTAVTAGDSFVLGGVGLFQGTYTAQQILDNGGIPPTQATALPNVLEWNNDEAYDGSNDFEQLAVNPIGSNLSQPYTIVVSGVVGAVGGSDRYMCGDYARSVLVATNGILCLAHAGTFVNLGKSFVQGDSFVAEITWDGASANAWVNGVKTANNVPLAAGVIAPSAWSFGQRGNNAGFWNGKLDGSSVHGAVIPDAQRKTIAKAFAAKGGITYAG